MDSTSRRFGNLSPLKQALLALEDLQARLAESERHRSEPIAIIGMGCRFPGGADPASFWQLMENGGDAVREVPASRWTMEDYFDADADAPGKMSSRWAGLLDQIDRFDPEFFGISPREAVAMDPQQRLLLEVAWEALENAGQGSSTLALGRTGVFVGMTGDEYAQLFYRSVDPSVFNAYFASGIARSVAAGRISYTLELQGPNLSVDTACSSSLVAVHTACLYLRMGECRVALAGGSNVVLSPEIGVAFSKAHMLAADGRCKTFDSRADGFVRGEGCGIVVLKRLSDALADGDNIMALIRGSAINQDGRSSGLTAPNGAAQEALIRQALASGGVKATEISYVEAHGTGTSLGDPIEAHALAAVLGPQRSPDNPLIVGSVKTNLGHLESAAGVAGLIKVVLALQHEQIPAHLHFQTMNPHIDWGGMPVEIPVLALAWPRGEKKRVAGISSFGFSGTNAHLIVEEAPAPPERVREMERPLHILALSARNGEALQELRARYVEELKRNPAELADICYTANAGRAHFEHRMAVVGGTAEELSRKLEARKSGEPVKERGGIRPVFLFSGQGSQYAGMGKQLYETQPVFRKALEECEELLGNEWEERLREVLWGEASQRLEQTAYTQPALFALEYALAELWKSWGVEPGAVLGHSVGEYVAACVAGVYGLADGLKLIAARGRLMQAVSGQGAMLAVMAAEAQVRAALAGLEERVSIAALNAPENTVISGYAREVAVAEERLQAAGVRVERLRVSHGFHSPQMEEMEAAFEEVAGKVRYAVPRVKLLSSVTGKELGRGDIDAEYWRRQVCQPVRFQAAMQRLQHTSGSEVYLEVGPGSTLASLGRQCRPGGNGTGKLESLWLVSIRKGRGEWEQLLESLGRLYEHGAKLDWDAFDQGYARRRVPLPTYPFQRQRYWIESTAPPKRTKAISDSFAAVSAEDVGALAKRNEKPACDDWSYRVAWQEQAPRESSESSAARHWVILPDSTGISEALASRIRSTGLSCSIIGRDARDLDSALAMNPTSSTTIVDLRCVDTSDLTASYEVCSATASVVRDLVKISRPDLKFWLVTRGAQSTGYDVEAISSWQAPVWGLGRTMASENAEFWGGLVDLDSISEAIVNSDLLWTHLTSGDGEDQAAFRGGRRFVARLERHDISSASSPSFREDGAYLITGGLGGLGLEIARWMVKLGARRLILMGRTPLPPRSEWDSQVGGDQGRAISIIRELEHAAVIVDTESVDVSDVESLQGFVRTYLAAGNPPIRGIVHAAGVLRHALVSEATDDDFLELFRAKVSGAWSLHLAFERTPLDFFVLFSSASSVLSSPRLGPYAAANSFLDALAAYRQGTGLPALSVNWGVWGEAGMAARSNASTVRALSERGMGSMATAEALVCLGRLLNGDLTQATVVPVNWQKWAELYPAYMASPFLSSLAAELIAEPTGLGANGLEAKSGRPRLGLVERLMNAPESSRLVMLREHVHAVAVRVLGFAVDRQIDPKLPLNEFGLDSLMALEFRNALSSDVVRSLPATFLFSYPTIDDVTSYLARLLFDSVRQTVAVTDIQSPDVLENIEELSDEEVERRLATHREEVL